MKAVVIYESMYGNTHLIANAIAKGLSESADVVVVPVGKAEPSLLADADLIVVGGPTHAHSVSRPGTRKAAVAAADKPDSDLVVEPDAAGAGLRYWFATLAWKNGRAAAFDTRVNAPPVLTGRASKGITRMLRHHSFSVVADPESFLVTKADYLETDEETRARDWGAQLAAVVGALTTE